MIRLEKGSKPTILVEKEAEWTKEYKDALGPPRKMTDTIEFRYRHPDIKDALRQEAYSKCIYCETLVATGETDHLLPVSKHPDKVVAWDNLGLVCKECNGSKSNIGSSTAVLVNPFEDDPKEHLIFLSSMVFPVPDSDKGRATYLACQLDRIDLVQRKTIHINLLVDLARAWKTEPDPEIKKMLLKRLVAQGLDPKEYAAAVRSYICAATGLTWAKLKP